MNRRDLIATAAVLPVVATTPALAAPQPGPIENCYHEYRRRNDWLNENGTDEDTDSQLAWIDEPIEQGMAMRPETVAEFSAYLLLATLDGMQMEGSQQSEDVIALAREMLTSEA